MTPSPDAKIKKVNDVSAHWAPYAYAGTIVTITADTEIFSLNGKPIGGGDYDSEYPDTNNKKTVKFTMPNEDVVLSSGELVMQGGRPVGTSGKGWSYDSSTQTLTLTYGTFDFSFTYPQNAKGAGAEPVKCAIESYATISGGIFDKAVTNDTEGTISGNGTFKGEVKNHNGTISGGKFEGTVINDVNGTISDGTFNKEVSNINGNISNGTFNETVINNAGGIISDGTFKGTVSNYNGTISGGTFAGSVSNNGGTVNGGIFNGNTGLDGVTNLHSITVASGAKIEKVNGVLYENSCRSLTNPQKQIKEKYGGRNLPNHLQQIKSPHFIEKAIITAYQLVTLFSFYVTVSEHQPIDFIRMFAIRKNI